MGAHFYVVPRLRTIFGSGVTSVKRRASASPATGSGKAHQMEQQALLALAFASWAGGRARGLRPASRAEHPGESRRTGEDGGDEAAVVREAHVEAGDRPALLRDDGRAPPPRAPQPDDLGALKVAPIHEPARQQAGALGRGRMHRRLLGARQRRRRAPGRRAGSRPARAEARARPRDAPACASSPRTS